MSGTDHQPVAAPAGTSTAPVGPTEEPPRDLLPLLRELWHIAARRAAEAAQRQSGPHDPTMIASGEAKRAP